MLLEPLLIAFAAVLFALIVTLVLSGRKHIIPAVSVSLGILFTFIGITIALVAFDAQNIQASVPALLDGMKLAFFTSIAGMGVGILARVIIAHGATSKGATMDTLAHQLEGIRKALVGEGEATVHTQLAKLHLAFREKQDVIIAQQSEMVTVLREFAENVAEHSIEALVEAIEEVMRDFNAKINEQLGDNFAKFNEGLGRMLDWQQAYKVQVEWMVEQMMTGMQALKASEEALAKIEERSRRFTETAEHLQATIELLNEEVEALENDLEAFASLANDARSAFPTIEARLNDLTQGFSEKVLAATSQIEEAADGQRQAITELTSAIREEHATLGRSIEGIARDTSEHIAKQFEVLDEELGNELEKALTTLGSQLTSLSNKFVEDYTPLTTKLQRLVDASRPLDGTGTPNGGNGI